VRCDDLDGGPSRRAGTLGSVTNRIKDGNPQLGSSRTLWSEHHMAIIVTDLPFYDHIIQNSLDV
jgi:hypothetical protein